MSQDENLVLHYEIIAQRAHHLCILECPISFQNIREVHYSRALHWSNTLECPADTILQNVFSISYIPTESTNVY